MSRNVVLSVNGRNGLDKSTLRQQPEQNWDLVRAASTSIHGINGTDAPEAVPGEPAGLLSIELLESESRPEGFVVKTIAQVPENRIPQLTEILPHRDVVLQAIGGDGEPGRRGGDGTPGRDGIPGTNATQAQDATNGTAGGTGGRAGAGSNGADGGKGGKINICVDEDNTHLLLATTWDISGGKGGGAGEHGIPGPGGKGGEGGRSFTWEEQNGYQYRCTENCAGRTTQPASTVKALAGRTDPRMALVNAIGSQVAAGSSLQNAVVRLAQYRANTPRDTAGLCECSGGNGHCTGCAALPVYQIKERVPGQEGAEGRRGDVPTNQLFSGADGRPGEANIIVTSKTGEKRSYRSRFQLELVDFDIEDENEDGIFEPGEHIFIRRIRVKNTGGMPSPKKETRLEIDPSECLQPINTHESQAFVPQVLPGQIITLTGSIKVLIREPDMPILGGEPYRESTLIKLKAIMPGLNRRLDYFGYQKSIDIEYPLELREIDYLDSVAQGSEHRITMKVHNKSNKPFGGEAESPRLLEVKIWIPSETGSLLLSNDKWGPETAIKPGAMEGNASVKLTQVSKISHLAKDHTYAEIRIGLHITPPGPVPSNGKKTRNGDAVQTFDLRIQVSSAHVYNDEAAVLVVTNARTPSDQFEAIGYFIRNDLNLIMDVWNVSLYGGLVRQTQDNEEDKEIPNDILNEYRGKTVIFLGNQFEHFGVKAQTILDLCESRVIANECFAGTSCLLLGPTAEKQQRETWLKDAVFPITHKVSGLEKMVAESSTFDNTTTFITSICEQKTAGTSVPRAYILENNPKWYHGSARIAVKLRAKQTRRHLRSKLPQERFWVCPILPRIEGARPHNGYVAIWHGLPSRGNIFAAESKPLVKERRKQTRLHNFDAFNIVSALSPLLRIQLLCSSDRNQEDSEESLKDKDEGTPSVDSDDPASYSQETLNGVQYSLEEDVCNEIKNYLTEVPLINNIAIGAKTSGVQFRVHFPCLETIMQQVQACEGTPVRALEVLKTAIAATNPQKKRQVVRECTIPFGQRQAQLKSYLMKRVETLFRDKGYRPDRLKAFRASIMHSRLSSAQRNTARRIEARNVEFTGVYTEEYRKGRKTTLDLVPKTVICTAAEWDAHYQEIEKAQHKLKRSVTRAFEKRARMSTLKLDSSKLAGSSKTELVDKAGPSSSSKR